jgi:hypothetical protein
MPYFGDAMRKFSVTVYAKTVSEQPDAPVRFRPDMMSLPVYRQGNPPPPGGIKLSSNEVPFSPSASCLEGSRKPTLESLPGRDGAWCEGADRQKVRRQS